VQEAKSLCALGIVCENSFDLRGAVNAYRKMLMGAQKAQEMLRSSLERAMAESLHPEDAANKPIDAVLCAENLLAAALLRSGQLEDAYSQCLMYISHCGTDYAPIGHTNALLCQMALGHMDTALEHAEQAVNAAEDNQDLLMIWTCCGNAALVRFHRHEFHEAAAAMERSFEVSKLLRRRDLEAVSLYLWGQMLREAGRLAEAAARLEEALALARKVEAKELATIAGMSLGIAKGELAYAELCSVSTKQSSP
jgi:tetratricopeptide (TPR) repeat protein